MKIFFSKGVPKKSKFWKKNKFFLTIWKYQKTLFKTFLRSTLFLFGPLFQQAEKLKSRELKDKWWKMKDEWLMKKDVGWGLKDEEWRMNDGRWRLKDEDFELLGVLIYDRQTDGRTDIRDWKRPYQTLFCRCTTTITFHSQARVPGLTEWGVNISERITQKI